MLMQMKSLIYCFRDVVAMYKAVGIFDLWQKDIRKYIVDYQLYTKYLNL